MLVFSTDEKFSKKWNEQTKLHPSAQKERWSTRSQPNGPTTPQDR